MSRRHFATLTPANALAKAAFDQVIAQRLECNVEDLAKSSHDVSTHVFPNREFDKGVRALRRRMAQARLVAKNSITSDSATEDTDIEDDTGVSATKRLRAGFKGQTDPRPFLLSSLVPSIS